MIRVFSRQKVVVERKEGEQEDGLFSLQEEEDEEVEPLIKQRKRHDYKVMSQALLSNAFFTLGIIVSFHSCCCPDSQVYTLRMLHL